MKQKIMQLATMTTIVVLIFAVMHILGEHKDYVDATEIELIESTKKLESERRKFIIMRHDYEQKVESLERTIRTLEEKLNLKSEMRSKIMRGTPSAFNINIPSGFTENDLKMIWDSLNAHEMKGKESYFIEAEKRHGVNAVFLVALSHHESNRGKSSLAKNKNNYFGWGAYDDDPYNYAHHFDNKRDGVLTVASDINRIYGGQTIKQMNSKYATDRRWHMKIWREMKQIVDIATTNIE